MELTDDAVSREHALARLDGDRVTVFDLGSRTGTTVDGNLIAGRRLASGDVIALGHSELVFTHVEAANGNQ